MFIKHRCVETIKQVVTFLLVLLEELQVLEDALLDRHLVVITNGILSEEIKHNYVFQSIQLFMQSHMFVAKRAATYSVCLIFVFLVT